MKCLQIQPLANAVKAEVTVPGSKSYTLRALFIAAMTPGKVRVDNPLNSDDTDSMLSCLKTLGIKYERKPSYIEVRGSTRDIKAKDYKLDVGLSGITLRFMLALSSVIPGRQTITGQPGVDKRPIGVMVESLRELGADIKYLRQQGYPPIRVNSSSFSSSIAEVSGTESSQYLSALLLVAPLAGGLNIKVKGDLVSRPYTDMTTYVMRHFGVALKENSYREYKVSGEYKPGTYKVEGDISSAAYFFAIATLTSSTITVKGTNPDSKQADTKFLEILEKMGSKVKYLKDGISVTGAGVKPLSVNMRACPDQAQTLAVLAAFAKGKTVIEGVKSLRVKETERVKAVQQELKKMGIKTSSTDDKLTVYGGDPQPTIIDTYGDHRMAMSFAVAGAQINGIKIQNPAVVSKTFPDFWKKLDELGVKTKATRPNLVLIGMRGSGKTTIAKALGRKLNMEYVDLDEIMADRLELSTPEIVEKYGWGYFRDQESAIAKEVSATDNKLISTGGGVILKSANVKALKSSGVIILLRASAEVLIRRLGSFKGRPPLTNAKSLQAEVRQVLAERQKLYEAAADLIIDTDRLKPAQVVDQIIKKLGED